MQIYEKRTYAIKVGQMAQLIDLYQNQGYPILERDGFADHIVGYFISDTGPLHQLIHIYRFEDDAARRAFWARLYANEEFMAVAKQLRSLMESQDVQLMKSAPWGARP